VSRKPKDGISNGGTPRTSTSDRERGLCKMSCTASRPVSSRGWHAADLGVWGSLRSRLPQVAPPYQCERGLPMKQSLLGWQASVWPAPLRFADKRRREGTVDGQYVESATPEVFTGGCIMGSEAATLGKTGRARVRSIARGRRQGVLWGRPSPSLAAPRRGQELGPS